MLLVSGSNLFQVTLFSFPSLPHLFSFHPKILQGSLGERHKLSHRVQGRSPGRKRVLRIFGILGQHVRVFSRFSALQMTVLLICQVKLPPYFYSPDFFALSILHRVIEWML